MVSTYHTKLGEGLDRVHSLQEQWRSYCVLNFRTQRGHKTNIVKLSWSLRSVRKDEENTCNMETSSNLGVKEGLLKKSTS